MKLWQELKKEDVDYKNELTPKEWERFVQSYEDVFARESSELGNKLLWEFQCNDLKYLRKTEQENV